MTDDLKNYAAPRPRMDLVWATLAACLAVVACVERVPENVAPQAVPSVSSSPSQPAEAASYVPCPKLSKGRWLRAEIAHWRKDGWVIFCEYDGMRLMTREELSL